MAPSFPPAYKGGGPARTLEALVREAPARCSVAVFAPDRDHGDRAALPVTANAWSVRDSVLTYYASVGRFRQLARLYREVRRRRAEVLYLNSLFNVFWSVIPVLLTLVGYLRPRVVLLAPRGELDAGALRISRVKKRILLAGYRVLRVHRRVVWHASAPMEAASIRAAWGADVATLIRQNETSLPSAPLEPRGHDGELRAVFLSRLSPKKGLLQVLEALASVRSSLSLDVFGPAEDVEYVARCEAAAARLPSNISVRFLGPLDPSRVRATLAAYDVKFFPTAGENFGHVIAEALSAGCPVVVPDTTPWSAVLRGGGGAVVEPSDRGAWSAIIEEYARRTREGRLEQRRHAAAAYSRWCEEPAAPHVFELLVESNSWTR